MERYEQARNQMAEERRKVQVIVEKERRNTQEFIDNNNIIVHKKRVYLYGQMKGVAHLEATIREQLLGS